MPELPWESLFSAPAAAESTVIRQGRLVWKHGRPLLFLPKRPAAAVTTASLYPAQSAKARLARGALKWFLRLRAPLGSEAVELRLSKNDPFTSFLAQCAGTPGLPEFGILAGNPSTSGTRFIILAFGQSGAPEAVIKAGSSAAARDLLNREERFLQSADGRFPGIPRVGATFHDSKAGAFAMEYVYGDSPRAASVETPASLLGSWIQQGRKIPLGQLPAWQRLTQAAPERDAPELRQVIVSPVVFHGDFAPWNIRVSSSGAWTVLDWERGELDGVPCWDWFHFVLQPAILVKQLGTSQLLGFVESLLNSEALKQYAARTLVSGHERQLLQSYLAYSVHVLRPSEGLARTQELLTALKA